MKPIIGINGNFGGKEGEPPLVSVRANYVDAVVRAGGAPVVLPAIDDASAVERQVEMCDGFIFTGGPDIDPALYGQPRHPTVRALNKRRERFDLDLIKRVVEADKPFLGICLGCQEVNVALGGTLIQDIYSCSSTDVRHTFKQDPYLHRHVVSIEAGSRLHELLKVTSLDTNSAHHQCVDAPGERVRVVARAGDATIEAFEVEGATFGFGIQWHPEYLAAEPLHLRLFEGLVEAARATAVLASPPTV